MLSRVLLKRNPPEHAGHHTRGSFRAGLQCWAAASSQAAGAAEGHTRGTALAPNFEGSENAARSPAQRS